VSRTGTGLAARIASVIRRYRTDAGPDESSSPCVRHSRRFGAEETAVSAGLELISDDTSGRVWIACSTAPSTVAPAVSSRKGNARLCNPTDGALA
jgi:hypothetical protein